MLHSLLTLLIVSGGITTQTQPESAAESVSRTARAYRIAVYQSYHERRSEYDARTAVGERIATAFVTAGSPEAFAAEICQWFEAAQQSSNVPALPACLTELERLAAERESVRHQLTGTVPSRHHHQTVVESQSHGLATVATESHNTLAEEQPAARKTQETESGFLGGLGRSIMRATISSEGDTARFE